MSNRVNLARNITDFEESPSFLPYGKVVIHTDSGDVSASLPTYSASTHRTFEIDSPFTNVSWQDAQYILDKIGEYAYKPFSASGALLDPAAQLGDIVTLNGVTSVLGSIATNFSTLCAAEIEAPQSEEINHEYNYETKEERELSGKLTEGQSYYGVQIDDNTGFTSSSVGGAKVVINSSELSFYYGSQRVLYFDPVARKYLFTGDVNIQDGALTFSKLDASARTRTDNDILADGLYSGGTFISGTSIYSPTIFANDLIIFPDNNLDETGSFEIYGRYNNQNFKMFKIEYDGSSFPEVYISSPQGASLDIGLTRDGDMNAVNLYGIVRLYYNNLLYTLSVDSQGYVKATR